MPGWLTAVLVAVGLTAILAVVFLYVLPSSREQTETKTPAAALEKPSALGSSHPLAKYIEVTGFRITEDAQRKAKVQFVVVNHSTAEIADLSATISLKPVTAKPADAPLCTFSVKLPLLAPYQARDMTATVQMKLRAYELPDWQFLGAELRITGP